MHVSLISLSDVWFTVTPDRLQYESCTSACLRVSHISYLLKIEKGRKAIIGMNVSQGRSGPCSRFTLKGKARRTSKPSQKLHTLMFAYGQRELERASRYTMHSAVGM